MPKKKNPTLHMKVDGLILRVAKLEVDVKWLKAGYWIQVLFGFGSFISVLTLVLRFLEVI